MSFDDESENDCDDSSFDLCMIYRYAPQVEYPDHEFHVELARELRKAVIKEERC